MKVRSECSISFWEISLELKSSILAAFAKRIQAEIIHIQMVQYNIGGHSRRKVSGNGNI